MLHILQTVVRLKLTTSLVTPYYQSILLKKIVLSKVKPPNQSGAEVGCTPNRPSLAGCLAHWMRFGNHIGLSFLMLPSILAVGNVWDHILVFMSLPQEDIWASFFVLFLFFNCTSWVTGILGTFLEREGLFTRLCGSGDHDSSWAGNFPAFLHRGQILGPWRRMGS